MTFASFLAGTRIRSVHTPDVTNQTTMTQQQRSVFEEVKVASNQLVERVREIIRDGDARRVIIKKGEHVYFEIPLTYGIGGAMAAIWLAPTLAAVGAVAALVTDVELVVEKTSALANIDNAEILDEKSTPADDETRDARSGQ